MPDKQIEHLIAAVETMQAALLDQQKLNQILIKALSIAPSPGANPILNPVDAGKSKDISNVCSRLTLHAQSQISDAKSAADDPTRS